MKLNKILIVSILISLMLLTGCFIEIAKGVEGEWTTKNTDGTIELLNFNKDDSFTWNRFNGETQISSISGTYDVDMPLYNGSITPVIELNYTDPVDSEKSRRASILYQINHNADGIALELITDKSTIYYTVKPEVVEETETEENQTTEEAE